jgi:pimeloyl-ACP methyl ester carboxylesterase
VRRTRPTACLVDSIRTVTNRTSSQGPPDSPFDEPGVYDEFAYFADNASEVGLPYPGPPVVGRAFVDVAPDRQLSALVWGDTTPELVLIHGGSQNAHTWDTVALALDRPLVAVDLPGHGHSADALERANGVEEVATVIRALAPDARAVVGMSAGGIMAMNLCASAPDVVARLGLVDITPGVTNDKARSVLNFTHTGPQSFASFAEILERTVEHNPGRSLSSLRRGVLHNAHRLDDGRWAWRYMRGGPLREPDPESLAQIRGLWEVLSALEVPLLLVRGMRPSSVVDDADEAELRSRVPEATVAHVPDAGHSVQGDAPLELARLLDDFVP